MENQANETATTAVRKDFLEYENARNRANHVLYQDILHKAFGKDGVLIAHHLTFGGDENPDEIPSADTMIFDHEIAQRVFGENYLSCLSQLAQAPCQDRDKLLSFLFYGQENAQTAGA